MAEIWKDIIEYKGSYQVSDLGRVRSLDRTLIDGRKIKGKILKPSNNSYGYYQIGLTKDGITTKYYVHRLVYNTFVGEIVDGNDINHIDHNKGNNIPTNLESITHQANVKDQAIFANGVYKDSNDYEHSHKCPICGNVILYKSIKCRNCTNLSRISYKIKKVDIINSLNNSKGNFSKSAKEFNMTDNALRKWCKKYDLPSKSGDWKSAS